VSGTDDRPERDRAASGTDDRARFDRVDWTEIDRSRTLRSTERLVFAAGLCGLLSLFVYDRRYADVYTVGNWRAEPVDWLFLLGVVILVAYGVVPALKRGAAVRRVLGRMASRPLVALALAYLGVFVLVGLIGPFVQGTPRLRFHQAYQPPVGFSTGAFGSECVGRVTGDVFDQQCHGSWEFPLGTNERGHPMGFLLVSGARIALYVTVITLVFVVPVAAAVGVLAGTRGGLVDALLSSYVDVQLSIPAIMLYFVGYTYWGPSLLLLIVAFGLLSWGGIARLVRSEVIQRAGRGHVAVARSLGASERYVARHHILPNVTNTLAPALCQLLALLVLYEAGVAFLGYHELGIYSWGSTIAESVNAEVASEFRPRAETPAYRIWWVSALPAAALTLTMLSFKLVGDALRDALDPRGEG